MTIDSCEENKPLEWRPHDLPIYDEVLNTGCAAEAQRLATADSEARLKFITDPREVHARLYASLTPASHPEYAGTYRGTAGTTLEHRRSGVLRDDDHSFQEFVSPDKVALLGKEVTRQAEKVFALPRETPPGDVLSEIVRLFYAFGLVHPFLDGNGHIQRLIFTACVLERDALSLSSTWTIHPRPYDIEIKRAFEASTTEARLADLRAVLSAYVSS
jgi:fido (protein-threonine AMPylation protein)